MPVRLEGGKMKLITSDELCEQLRMKKSTLYQMTCAKQIPYIKVGGLLRFDPKQIDEWLEQKSVLPIDAA
jgi:excisionase family DNA binding protein